MENGILALVSLCAGMTSGLLFSFAFYGVVVVEGCKREYRNPLSGTVAAITGFLLATVVVWDMKFHYSGGCFCGFYQKALCGLSGMYLGLTA